MNGYQRSCLSLIAIIWVLLTFGLLGNLLFLAGMDVIVSSLITGLFSSIAAGFISMYLIVRYEILFQLKTELIRLRNILYDIEWAIDLSNPFPIPSSPNLIRTTDAEDGDWREWRTGVRDIQAKLFQIKRSMCLQGRLTGGGVWGNLFMVSAKSTVARQHFEKIDSVFITARPTDILGIIECATEAHNLLNHANSRNSQLNRHAVSYKNYLDTKVGMCVDMKRHEDELEKVRLQIKTHREYIEDAINKHLPDGVELLKLVCLNYIKKEKERVEDATGL